MTNDNQIAADIQARVMQAETKNLEDGFDQYDDDVVRQAIVHARQDIVLLVHHASRTSTHLRKVNVKLNLLILVALAILIAMLLD